MVTITTLLWQSDWICDHCDSWSQWPPTHPQFVLLVDLNSPPQSHLWGGRSTIPLPIPFRDSFIADQRSGWRKSCSPWLCVLDKMFLAIQHVALHYYLHLLPAPNPNDTFGLICKAYSVIHLRCYGGKKRFMTHNKLLRSCMWWGNQGRKWGGNSLLHATLIHPSVRETPHYAHLI